MKNTFVMDDGVKEVIRTVEVDEITCRFTYHDYTDGYDRDIVTSGAYGEYGDYNNRNKCLFEVFKDLIDIIEDKMVEIIAKIKSTGPFESAAIEKLCMTYYNIADGRDNVLREYLERDENKDEEDMLFIMDVKDKLDKEADKFRAEIMEKINALKENE